MNIQNNRKIGIAAGHSRSTPDPLRHLEWRICMDAVDTLEMLLKRGGFEHKAIPAGVYDWDNDAALRQKVLLFNQSYCRIAVELHLNAGGGNYSAAFYWTSPEGQISKDGEILARQIAASLNAVLPWRSVGARPITWAGTGGKYFLNATQMPAVIIEAGFKDNDQHLDLLNTAAGQALYGAAVFHGIMGFFNERDKL